MVSPRATRMRGRSSPTLLAALVATVVACETYEPPSDAEPGSGHSDTLDPDTAAPPAADPASIPPDWTHRTDGLPSPPPESPAPIKDVWARSDAEAPRPGDGDEGRASRPCGEGTLRDGEECHPPDDGHTPGGGGDDPVLAGCAPWCTEDNGWVCEEQSGVPRCSPVCGDGLLVGDEGCDDGNLDAGDGCNEVCAVEEGWSCDGPAPSTCNPICGDGLVVGGEECDDGNLETGDGCCDECVVEPGWTCAGSPSECSFAEQLVLGPSLGLGLLTGQYDGSLESMKCATGHAAVLPAATAVQQVQAVLVGLWHTRVGDLTIKLVSPSGTVITLVSRPGWKEPYDNGAGAAGAKAQLHAHYPIAFRDTAPVSAEDMGKGLKKHEAVCQHDGQCTFHPDPGAAGGPGLWGVEGEPAAGPWSLCVGESFSFDTGSLEYVEIQLVR